MSKIALLLACLVYICHSRRARNSTRQLQESRPIAHQKAVDPSRAFASLVLALDPAAGVNPSSPDVRLPIRNPFVTGSRTLSSDKRQFSAISGTDVPCQWPMAGAWRNAGAALSACMAGLVGSALDARTDGGILARILGASPAWAADDEFMILAEDEEEKRYKGGLSHGQRKRARQLFKQKLSKIPVFMVTNGQGMPYISQHSSGNQAALMFLHPREAQQMLDNINLAPNVKDAQVFTTNLERCFRLAKSPPMSSGNQDSFGNDYLLRWQFKAHDGGVADGNLTLEERREAFLEKGPLVPCHVVDGLTVKRGGKSVRPIFMSKRDAKEAVLGVDGADSKRRITTYDAMAMFTQLDQDIDYGEPGVVQELKSIEFVPDSASTKFKKEVKEKKGQRPARIFPVNG